MKPIAKHVHPSLPEQVIHGRELEPGDTFHSADQFPGRAGWQRIHPNWHGQKVVRPTAIVVRASLLTLRKPS